MAGTLTGVLLSSGIVRSGFERCRLNERRTIVVLLLEIARCKMALIISCTISDDTAIVLANAERIREIQRSRPCYVVLVTAKEKRRALRGVSCQTTQETERSEDAITPRWCRMNVQCRAMLN